MAAISTGGAGSLPRTLRVAAEAVASPGEFLWWLTLGGAFAGRPTSPTGLLVWFLGTAAFWFITLLAAALAASKLRNRETSHSNATQ